MDNSRALEDAALSLTRELPRLQPLPTCGGQPRVQLLARELISHSDAKLNTQNIQNALEAWQGVQLLRLRELWTLPVALRATLVELISHLAQFCVNAQRDRSAAEAWAHRLTSVDALSLQHKFARAPRSTCFLEHLLKCLRDQENAPALSWLDKQLDSLDLRAQHVVEREHARQTLERQWISCAITSLRTLGQIHWSELLEALSSVESWLRKDPAGVYPRMDIHSRALYRQRVERIARLASLSEIQVARNTFELADLADEGEEMASLTRHVGYYLLDEGLAALWRRMGGQAPAIGANAISTVTALACLALRKRKAPLYVALRISGTLALCACAPGLGMHAGLLPFAAFVLSAGCETLLHTALRHLYKPRILPRIAFEHLPPSQPVLVVVPTLLSQPAQAQQMLRHLAVLQRANPDPNLHYMLLVDFPDGPAAQQVDDADITREALTATRKLNSLLPGTFLYLHRKRVWNAAQRKFMGPERKRGALAALNELLLNGHAQDPFAAASVEPASLQGRYRQVITLDSDTLLPPGSALELVGPLSHPLNRPMRIGNRRRGYGLIQPRMETTAHSARTRIARIWGGTGGVDPYLTATSDIYQDLCGRGSFAGKGIYDVDAFQAGTHDMFRPNTILSHDLLEGELCCAALASDVALYDSQPGTLRSWMMRLHRWTRGDWQLLPWLFPLAKTNHNRARNPLDILSRYKIWDNLRRSLVPPMRLLLLALGMLASDPVAVLSALLIPELCLAFSFSWQALRAAGLQLALLPYHAYTLADALLRTIWRVCFSRRHLLEWVTAADAERHSGDSPRPALVCAVAAGCLLACGLTGGWTALIAMPTAVVWLLTPQLVAWLDAPTQQQTPLTDSQRNTLLAIAQDTWRFFETTVTAADHFLPPDNLQVQPDRGLAHRTSPTNIGLYLLSCVSAHRLGLLEADEMARRIQHTLIPSNAFRRGTVTCSTGTTRARWFP